MKAGQAWRRLGEGAIVRFIDADEVRGRLTHRAAIRLVREAMIAFSRGQTRQLLRSIISLAQGNLFGVMPGALGASAPFGAKLVSVFPANFAQGGPSHQGLIVVFDPKSGAPACVVDAGEVTAIRTAAASAAATDVLARSDATRLAVLGYGEQATQHLRAIGEVRRLSNIMVWGRNPDRSAAFATRMRAELGILVAAAGNAREAVADADIVCTVTPATEPILEGAWLLRGTHVNLVGSGHLGQVEADSDVVVRSRFIVDSREGVAAQGSEFVRARDSGLVDPSHIIAEIGSVMAGDAPGRLSETDVTVYKSLGHVVQDLACAWALFSGEGLET